MRLRSAPMALTHRLRTGLALLLLLSTTLVNATIYTSVADGKWDSTATWGGVKPPVKLGGHTVIIKHRVEYPNGLGDLYIESGTLRIDGGILVLRDCIETRC